MFELKTQAGVTITPKYFLLKTEDSQYKHGTLYYLHDISNCVFQLNNYQTLPKPRPSRKLPA